MCAATDKPIAALLQDLKARGLLEDTLVLWSTEFGRMPFSQGGDGPRSQRRHVRRLDGRRGRERRRGLRRERRVVMEGRAQQATSTYDFHATVLHLLGIDHEKLTFRHNGADRRLTDVHGEVIHEVLI